MQRRTRSVASAVLAVALSTVALSTAGATADRAASRKGGAAEAGLTADGIKISYVYPDTSALEQAGILEKLGDRAQHLEVAADTANEAGGAAGRRLEITAHTFPTPSTASDERTACVAATEDDDAFIVIFGGNQTEETLLCVTDEHERVGLAIAANARKSTFDASGGRLFTNDMSADRLMQAWVQAVKKQRLLKGATVGIVRPNDSAHAAVAKTLKKALDKAGVSVEEEVALPCAGLQACEQGEVGAQRLQTKGIDTVFSLLNAVAYPAFVGSAGTIGYEPQWLSSDYEYQVYDTTAKLFGDVKDAYDGAIGISTTVFLAEPDKTRIECNQRFTDATGITEEPISDAWQDIGTACAMVDHIVTAANAAEQAGGLTQERFIEEYQKLTIREGNRKGSFGPKQHDGYDTYQLYAFRAACTCWKPLKKSVGALEP